MHQRPLAAQEPFFVGIQNGHQRHLGKVQAFPQQVHADKHVEPAFAQVVHDFNALHGFYVGVDVAAPNAVAGEELREFFGHPFGEGGNQDTFVQIHAFVDFFHKVVHLVFRRTHLDNGVQQSRGANDLFHNHPAGAFQFVVGRSGTHVQNLVLQGLEFVKPQRTVVHGCRKAEPVFHQIFLSGPVATVHSADLGQGDVAFVHHQHKVFWEVIQQAKGTRAGFPAVQVAGVVFNARAVAQFPDHLQVEVGAFFQAFGLQRTAVLQKEIHLLHQVVLDAVDGPLELSGSRDK